MHTGQKSKNPKIMFFALQQLKHLRSTSYLHALILVSLWYYVQNFNLRLRIHRPVRPAQAKITFFVLKQPKHLRSTSYLHALVLVSWKFYVQNFSLRFQLHGPLGPAEELFWTCFFFFFFFYKSKFSLARDLQVRVVGILSWNFARRISMIQGSRHANMKFNGGVLAVLGHKT